MKKTFVMISRHICRLIASALWQLVWLVPICVVCWYGKLVVPNIIHSHFRLDEAQDRLVSLEKFAEVMKANTSLSNPTALVHYISAQLTKFSIAAKLNTLEMTSNICETVCLWGINLLWIVALIYAVIRTIRLYRAKSEVFETACTVVRQLEPRLMLMHQDISKLREEIQTLKQTSLLNSSEKENILLPHE